MSPKGVTKEILRSARVRAITARAGRVSMLVLVALSVTWLLGACAGGAEELKSGIPIGKSVPAFQVEKCGGAPNDGVKVGDELCYR